MNTNRDYLLESGPLRLRFFWHADRYAHEILVGDGANWCSLATSVEGLPDEPWPASPPFQSLHVEHRDDGQAIALLVGMAGKSHWSASARIDPQTRCVEFDVACRVRDACAGVLRSTYQIAEGDAPAVSLAIEPGQQFERLRSERTGASVALRVDDSGGAAPRTIRWSYRLRPAGPSSSDAGLS